jgi:hypothetical protein
MGSDAVSNCERGSGVPIRVRGGAGADHEDRARVVSDREEAVGRAGWAVREVPGLKLSLLLFDQKQRPAAENEEVLLC